MVDGPPEQFGASTERRGRSNPWSVRKLAEQVSGRPFHEIGGPGALSPGTPTSDPGASSRSSEDPPASPSPEKGPTSRPEPETDPPLNDFLPGLVMATSSPSARHPIWPLVRPLPEEVRREVPSAGPTANHPSPPGSAKFHRKDRRELEKVYLSYLLLHLNHLPEPALRYLRHAVEEECRDRGLIPVSEEGGSEK
jgi:hypothetical protein